MNRDEFALAAMSPAGTAGFSRVQIQKALFLLDQNIPELTDGPQFNFKPYFYGPFDPEVYREIESLEELGFVRSFKRPARSDPSYVLTARGLEQGESALRQLSQQAQDYIHEVAEFVRSVSFADLVSAIYRAYPEMAENSVIAKQGRVASSMVGGDDLG